MRAASWLTYKQLLIEEVTMKRSMVTFLNGDSLRDSCTGIFRHRLELPKAGRHHGKGGQEG